MNLILLTEEDLLCADVAVVRDGRAVHLRGTLGVRPGDELRIGMVGGRIGLGEVTAVSDQEVQLRIELDQDPPKKLPLTVVLGLPRPKRMRQIFRTVAELGVRELIVLNCYRVEKSYWQTPHLEEGRIRQFLLEGLEQARDTVLPRITLEKRFKPFVEDRLPDLVRDTHGLVAQPGAEVPCPLALGEPVTLAIGPEGGFLPYEVAKLEEAGFLPVDLGPRTLTVATALTVSVARIYA